MEHKIAELFFENPGEEFYLRQIARRTRTPTTTVLRKLKVLVREKIILKIPSEPYAKYIADAGSMLYGFYKRQFLLGKLYKSGLLEYIIRETSPKVVILFGSCAKGEYTRDSDIDIFINASGTSLDLERFRLGHKINVFFEANLLNISQELRSNILNGIVMYGFARYEKTDGLQGMHETASKKSSL